MTATILQRLSATSVWHNGLLVPSRIVGDVIAHHAFNVFIGNDDDTYPVSVRGTGTALRFRDHELLVCTQHQLQGFNLQRVGMIADGGRLLVTSGGTRHYPPSATTDAYDLIAFNFSEPVAAHPQFRSRFFNLRSPDMKYADVLAYLVTGCTYEGQRYEVAEANHIGVVRRSIICRYGANQPRDVALLALDAHEPLSFNPDGMSGGSAFVVHRDPQGALWADFGGIVVHGGRTGFEVVKAAVVFEFLSTCSWPAASTVSRSD